jgi:2-polyprenyl-3-methyl-5-hydroxy-6-metoxy-1,4-benzoquinol methylase
LSIVRSYEKVDGILVFDSRMDESLSTYDAAHLEVLANREEGHFWFKNRRDVICKAIERHVPKSAKILEIGGGTGYVAAQLRNLGFAVEMADVHLNGLRYAQKKGIDRLYQFDLFNPPFREEFDLVCLFDVLEHMRDPFKALKCVKAMLKPKGMAILTVPAHQWLWSRDDVIAGHSKRYTRSELRELFFASGLQSVQIHYFFRAILPVLFLRRWLRKDDGSLLKKSEHLEIDIHPFFNRLFDLATRMDRFIPNLAGGSILAIAQ